MEETRHLENYIFQFTVDGKKRIYVLFHIMYIYLKIGMVMSKLNSVAAITHPYVCKNVCLKDKYIYFERLPLTNAEDNPDDDKNKFAYSSASHFEHGLHVESHEVLNLSSDTDFGIRDIVLDIGKMNFWY